VSEHTTSEEPYLLVEEVAERLGLPLSVLLHRVEAGDIPARRVERADGLHYALRLGDLGIELDDEGLRSAAIEDDAPQPDDAELRAEYEAVAPTEPTVENAIFSAFDSGPAPVPGTRNGKLDAPGGEEEGDASSGEIAGGWSSSQGGERPWQPAAEPPPPWALRPREPQQPPVWLTPEPSSGSEAADHADAAETVVDTEVVEVIEAAGPDEYLPPAYDAGEDVAELAVPPPAREPVSLVDAAASGPRGDLASMSLDARELVAGLLDRWERTLEQRIYTEQRQRFQAELVARQNMVKQLQMELHTARAEHAAAQAEKDRLLAGKERELADRERDLAETRRLAEEAERLVAPAASRRRRWFWNRDD
jgi:hypothetical protein